MSTVRLRRLAADFSQLTAYIRRHPRLKLIQSDGDPPERYQIEYHIRSLRQVNGELMSVKSHMVEIILPRNYPRVPPQCRMLTPVFHPNIAPHAICVGDHWNAGESLQSIVMRIGEILAYQSYNVRSPLNGEAARWVEQHKDELPLDNVSLLVEEPESKRSARPKSLRSPSESHPNPVADAPPTARRVRPQAENPPIPRARRINEPAAEDRPAAAAAKQRAPASIPVEATSARTVDVPCPECGTKYRVPLQSLGRRAECRKCHTVFNLIAPESTGPE